MRWGIEQFSPRIALTTALQVNGLALLDMAYEIDPGICVLTVDTGRLPEETFELIDQLRTHYFDLNLEVLFPESPQVEELVSGDGPNLFYRSVEDRRRCCRVRKVSPLARRLESLDAWITGLRRDQWSTRSHIGKVETDHQHGGIVKLNPLAAWTDEQVWDYVREREIPHHPLYERGYTSIGCAPCTRPTQVGESPRAGRWWWETSSDKECGMHSAVETGGF